MFNAQPQNRAESIGLVPGQSMSNGAATGIGVIPGQSIGNGASTDMAARKVGTSTRHGAPTTVLSFRGADAAARACATRTSEAWHW